MDKRMETELLTANKLLIEMLIQMAEHDAVPIFGLVQHARRQLVEVDSAARQRVAQRSCLLVDFGFMDGEGWRGLQLGIVRTRDTTWNSRFPRQTAVELARHVLKLAWHTVGAATPRASIRLGISLRVAGIMGQITLEEIERFADRYLGFLRPRWDDRPYLWQRFLKAARNGDTQVLESIDLHGAQILASDLMGSAS